MTRVEISCRVYRCKVVANMIAAVTRGAAAALLMHRWRLHLHLCQMCSVQGLPLMEI